MGMTFEPTLEGFTSYARQHQHLVAESLTLVEFIVAFTERAMLRGDDHTYDDPYLLVQLVSGAQGACFLHRGELQEDHLNGIAGQQALGIVDKVQPPISVAILDAYYAHLNIVDNIVASDSAVFRGVGSKKSTDRARKLVELAGITAGTRVLMIGVIIDIVRMALDRGAQLRLADFGLAGTTIFGLPVYGDATPMIDWADSIIMTGNTLKTNTLSSLLKSINQTNANLLIYALTGSNIAPRYTEFGANIVTVETFPFYWYANLSSKMKIYRRNIVRAG